MKKDPRHADILRSSRKIKQHRRLSHWFWSGFGVLVLVLVLVVLANLAIFKISEIKITGARVANASDLIQLIDRDLTGRRFFIFPRRNAWFYPEAEIRERIDKKFLNIEAVAFNLANISLMSNVNSFDLIFRDSINSGIFIIASKVPPA